MTNFDRCLRAANALTRHLEGRGTTTAEIADAVMTEALFLAIAVRGRAEVADDLRFVAAHLEASRGH